jgi:hypothetical protein
MSRVVCVAIAMLCGVASASAAGLPTTLDDVVILAQQALSFDPRVELVSGQVVVNDAPISNTDGLRVGVSFSAQTNTQVVADLIKVIGAAVRPAPVFFDIFANTMTKGPGTLTIDGTEAIGPGSVPLPVFAFPTAPVVVPGTTDIKVRQSDGAVMLPPGDYGQIRVGVHGVLILEGGTYNIRSLNASVLTAILFSGTTTVNVAERVSVGPLSVFGPQGGSVSPRCIVINVAGDRFWVSSTDVEATVNAPNANVRLGALGTYTGNFIGKTVKVGFRAVLGAPPTLTAACP